MLSIESLFLAAGRLNCLFRLLPMLIIKPLWEQDRHPESRTWWRLWEGKGEMEWDEGEGKDRLILRF